MFTTSQPSQLVALAMLTVGVETSSSA